MSILARWLTLLFGLFVMLGPGCSRQVAPNIERGSGYMFREGFPEARIIAIGIYDEEKKPAIEITTDIIKGSVIYKTVDKEFTAAITLSYQIVKINQEGRELYGSNTREFTITDSDQNVVTSTQAKTYIERIYVDPGVYEVTILVTDNTSNKQIARTNQVEIPDPASETTEITGVQLIGYNSSIGEYLPITTYDVPARFDSLVFRFSVVQPVLDNTPTALSVRLIRFPADTLPAREMSGIPFNPGSLPYRGIDYSNQSNFTVLDTLISSTETVLSLEIPVATPKTGNFRFQVALKNDEKKFKAREFSVKSNNFPFIKSISEIAEPLIYLMSRKEHERLMQLENPEEIKREIDRFWLSNLRNKNRAGQVIELYYSRVEEANKQFTNFKEGWKTDMGMIYILFGPPWYVENTIDSSTWFYSYNRSDPRYTVRFYRPRIADQHFPFQHYMLQRERFYHTIEYNIVQDWKSGHVLTTN